MSPSPVSRSASAATFPDNGSSNNSDNITPDSAHPGGGGSGSHDPSRAGSPLTHTEFDPNTLPEVVVAGPDGETSRPVIVNPVPPSDPTSGGDSARHFEDDGLQVAASSDPEPVSNLSSVGTVEDPTKNLDPAKAEFQEPEKGGTFSRLRGGSKKRKRLLIIGAIVAVLVIGIAVGLGAGLGIKNSSGDPGTQYVTAATSSTAQSSTLSSSATVSTSASGTATSVTASATSTSSSCSGSDTVSSVSFMGVAGKTGGWQWKLLPAKSANDCCEACFKGKSNGQKLDGGCNGWAYMPNSGSNKDAPCNVIYGEGDEDEDRDDESDQCPSGKVGITFATDGDEGNIGGAGPCGTNG